jgi:hypothetical protein
MTPKEKSKELFDKFYSAIPSDEIGENYNSAKQCALIAVDEILWLLNEIDYDTYSYNAIVFYNEVKQEIEKL